VNSSASPADNGRIAGRYMHDALEEGEPEAVDELITRVLRRAHGTAEGLDRPEEARAILHLAQSFADELATGDSCFDRLRFIHDATEDRS
jgi:hypothetical protein